MRKIEYEQQYKQFCEANDGRFNPKDSWPVLDQDRPQKADYSFEYLAHCGWAARILAETYPMIHVDFGSHCYFAGIASALVGQFNFYDIRPIDMPLPGLSCREGDLTNLDIPSESQQSVSCMHVLEHVGLGRYGDKLDPQGDLKAASELSRIVQSGGSLLIVEPINRIPRLSFNAHRIYSPVQVLDMFSGFSLIEFTLIKERSIIFNATVEEVVKSDTECNDTGCFWFQKI